MTTYSPQQIALAAMGTFVALWIACSIIYALLPAFSMNVMGALYHMPMPLTAISWGSFFVGLVSMAVAAYIGGYIFALFLGLGRKQRG